jgi:hypothetical protein
MSNQVSNMNPRNIQVILGTYSIDGFAAKEDALTFSGAELFSDLAQGLNVTTVTYSANVTLNINMKLNAGAPANNIIQAFAAARYNANTGLLPDEIALPASGIMNDIPLIIIFTPPSGIPSFILTTKVFTIANMVDLGVPFAASTTFDREWSFKATYEPQDLLGAAVTK